MPTVTMQTRNSGLVAVLGSRVGLEAADLCYDGWHARASGRSTLRFAGNAMGTAAGTVLGRAA